MPGFSFSPTLIGKNVIIHTKTGHTIPGVVIEVNPAEIVLKNPSYPDKLIRINRDEVTAYTGSDDVQRKPEPIELYLSRCSNPMTRCNGVKRIGKRPISNVVLAKDCPAFNDACEVKSCDFFKLRKDSVMRLLEDIIIDEYPKKMRKEEEDE